MIPRGTKPALDLTRGLQRRAPPAIPGGDPQGGDPRGLPIIFGRLPIISGRLPRIFGRLPGFLGGKLPRILPRSGPLGGRKEVACLNTTRNAFPGESTVAAGCGCALTRMGASLSNRSILPGLLVAGPAVGALLVTSHASRWAAVRIAFTECLKGRCLLSLAIYSFCDPVAGRRG